MNAIEHNEFTGAVKDWGKKLKRPKAILCVSAHWYVEGLGVLDSARPKTIHDFFGFPEELYKISYPAPGHPELARKTGELLRSDGAQVTGDWGLDHGTWSVLLHLFPEAIVPVYQVSIDICRSSREHFELAKKLKPLRDEGVLIIGSGNIVHNLLRLRARNAAPYSWAVEFDEAIKSALLEKDFDKIIDYQQSFPKLAPYAFPTPDHYLPFVYAMAAAGEDAPMTFPYEGFEHGSISMRAVQWG